MHDVYRELARECSMVVIPHTLLPTPVLQAAASTQLGASILR